MLALLQAVITVIAIMVLGRFALRPFCACRRGRRRRPVPCFDHVHRCRHRPPVEGRRPLHELRRLCRRPSSPRPSSAARPRPDRSLRSCSSASSSSQSHDHQPGHIDPAAGAGVRSRAWDDRRQGCGRHAGRSAFGLRWPTVIETALLTGPGGEFEFVALGAAAALGAVPRGIASHATLVIAVSMVALPLISAGARRLNKRMEAATPSSGSRWAAGP